MTYPCISIQSSLAITGYLIIGDPLKLAFFKRLSY